MVGVKYQALKKEIESERKWLLNRNKNVKVNADLSYKNVLKGPQGETQDFIQKKTVLSGVIVYKYWKPP